MGSFLAISEVILYYVEVVLDNISGFCKKFARHLSKNRIAELARLTNTLKKCIWILTNVQMCINLVGIPGIIIYPKCCLIDTVNRISINK